MIPDFPITMHHHLDRGTAIHIFTFSFSEDRLIRDPEQFNAFR